jgi:hypothetical protein
VPNRVSLPLTPSVSSALKFRPARSMMSGMMTLILTGLLRVLRTRRALVFENLALRHQLSVLQRTAPRPRLRTSDRLLWVLLSHLWRGWAEAVSIVQPETVIRWQRAGFTLFWTWKSRRSGPGRPSVAPEVRALIRRMSRANPLWGAPRTHGSSRRSAGSIIATSASPDRGWGRPRRARSRSPPEGRALSKRLSVAPSQIRRRVRPDPSGPVVLTGGPDVCTERRHDVR